MNLKKYIILPSAFWIELLGLFIFNQSLFGSLLCLFYGNREKRIFSIRWTWDESGFSFVKDEDWGVSSFPNVHIWIDAQKILSSRNCVKINFFALHLREIAKHEIIKWFSIAANTVHSQNGVRRKIPFWQQINDIQWSSLLKSHRF